MNKSKLKWRVIWIAYCIPAILFVIPALLTLYMMKPFGYLADRMESFKKRLIRKYKP